MKRNILLLFVFALALNAGAQSSWQLRFMPQVAFGGRNTVQQPNDDTGTRIHLSRDYTRTSSARFSPRIELEFSYNRHHILATAALLTDKFEGDATQDILYNGAMFAQGSFLEAVYRFNTYRLGYRYRLVEQPRFNLELGATLLLRDAFISLEDDSRKTKFDNVGVAPLISYYIEWRATERFSLLSYGDAFALKVGRAEDIFVGGKYQISPRFSATAGYRLLEGGSDGDEVFTMAAFHFISIGVGYEF